MSALPDVLSTADLPLAELHAVVLAGEAYPVADCFCPVDVAETRVIRASAVAAVAPPRFVADLFTASWIWGGEDRPPIRHQFCIDATTRKRQNAHSRFHLREVALGDGDVVVVGHALVTAPLRTLLDIGRQDRLDDAVAVAAMARLIVACALETAECEVHFERHRAASHTVAARARLARAISAVVDAVDVVDGVDATHGVQHTVEVGRVAHLEDEPAERQAVA